MDDDGPRPMRNMRPTQKQQTGADKFQSDHLDEYEMRGRQSRDKVSRVRAHNAAYPKMYDELDRRRSTAKPSMTTDRWHRWPRDDSLCCRCLRLRSQELLQENRYSKRSRSHHRRPMHVKQRSRITKPKRRQKNKYHNSGSRYFKMKKFTIDRSCQYYAPDEAKGASPNSNESVDDIKMAGCSKKYATDESQEMDANEHTSTDNVVNETKSEVSQNIVTNAPSRSSFNSFSSNDHEPMVE